MNDPGIDEIPGNDPRLAAELKAAGLPTDDLAEAGRRFFRFTELGRLVGFIGWEMVGEAMALLRSAVVLPAERHQGSGTEIVDWALTRLAELGVTDAYALTTSAEAFLLKAGFARQDRASTPPAIRASRQFASLCPVSAVVLRRNLP